MLGIDLSIDFVIKSISKRNLIYRLSIFISSHNTTYNSEVINFCVCLIIK